ncbi:hypothetical protein ACEPU1_32090 [Pseudomonas aeruginosa]
MQSASPEQLYRGEAKQFLANNLNRLCQELYAWRCQQELPPGGFFSRLTAFCNKYVVGDDEHAAAHEAETLIEQAALLYGAGSQSSPEEIHEQLRRGLCISMGPVPPRAR